MNRTTSASGRRMFILALAAALAFFIVDISGFLDTFTGSVTGCGKSWPLCHGSIMPWKWDVHAWIEFGHRFLVFSASMLLLLVSIAAWTRYRQVKRIRIAAGFALGAVLLESFLGALSVYGLNPPELMAAHMGVALTTFGALVVMTITIGQLHFASAKLAAAPVPPTLKRWTRGAIPYIYVVLYVGAYVASTGAGAYFRGFPVPTESPSVAGIYTYIDMAHRGLALGLLIWTFMLIWESSRIRRQRADLFVFSLLSFGLVLMQAFSGWLMIATHLALAAILLHVTLVSLLFTVFFVLNTLVTPLPAGADAPAGSGTGAAGTGGAGQSVAGRKGAGAAMKRKHVSA